MPSLFGRIGSSLRGLFRADAADAPAALALPVPQRRGDAVSLSFGGSFAGGWSNPVTGHGMPGKDSRLESGFTAGFMSDEMAIEMWRGDELTRKIVSMLCEEAMEPGVTLTIQDEEQTVAGQVDTRKAGDLVEDIERLHRELKTEAVIVRACEWERLFGGSAIWAGANDYQAGSFAEPLNLEAKGLAIRWLDVIRARDLTPYAYYEDPLHPKYGQPSVWSLSRVMSGGRIQQQAQIHESRLFLFRGRRIVDDGSVMSQNHHSAEFGDGILPGLVGALRRLSEALGNTEHAMRANGELIWTHQKLAEILGNEGNGDFERLVRAMQFASSILNARVVGADQTLTRQGVSLSGLEALLSEFKGEVAGLAGVPRTKLFAEVPGGLGNNATGPHGDWDETKAVFRKHSQLPAYEWITKLGFRSLGGEPRRWKLEGKPYRHPTEKEQADLVKLEADTDLALLGGGIVTADVVQGRPIWRERFSLPDPEAPEMGALPTGEMPDDIRQPGGAPDPSLAGADPAAAAPAPEQPKAADLALNGAQIIALNSTIKDVAAGAIPRSSGAAIVARAINISIEEAIGMMPPEGFVPASAPAKTPPPTVADARKDAKGERTIDALLKRLSPSGKCAECGKQKPLEVDHVHGRGWDPAEMSRQQRADKYWDEYDGGKKMRALCRECNARDGAANKQGKSGPAHRGDAEECDGILMPDPIERARQMIALVAPYQARALAGEDRDALVATLEFVEGIEPAWAQRLIPRVGGQRPTGEERDDCDNPIRGEGGLFDGCAPGSGGGGSSGGSRDSNSTAPKAARAPSSRARNVTVDDAKVQLATVDKQKASPMATQHHPRVSMSTNPAAQKFIKPDEFKQVFKEMTGTDVTMEEMGHLFAPPDGYRAVITMAKRQGQMARIGASFVDKDGKVVGSVQRYVDKDGTMIHDRFFIDESAQGAGFANTLNGQALARYEKLGIKKVELSAQWVGKYAWASTGFSFDNEEKIAKGVEGFLSKRFQGAELEEKKAVARELVKEPWNLAKWDDGNEYEASFDNKLGESNYEIKKGKYPLGKAILLADETYPLGDDALAAKWKGTMKIDRSNPGYLNALKKLKVEEKG